MLADKKQYIPGDDAKVGIASSQSNAKVLFSIMRRDKSIDEKWLTLREATLENVGIRKEDLGNVSVHALTIINARVHQKSLSLNVPWLEKQLKISYSSFRDKLLPGQEEEWIIKIEGSKKETVAAEILTGMYDASLDQFRSNVWSANYFPTLSAYWQLRAGKGFHISSGYDLLSLIHI